MPTILITGANRGIGRELLSQYQADGWRVIATAREPAAAGLASLEPLLLYGASPRASLALAQASRAQAFLHGRAFVTPADLKAVAPAVLRHRLVTTYEAEAEGLDADALVARVLETGPVP